MSMCGLHFLWPTPLADILQFLSVSILLHNFAQDYYCLEFMPNNFKFNSAVWHRFPMGLKDIVAQDEGTNVFFFPAQRDGTSSKCFPCMGRDKMACPVLPLDELDCHISRPIGLLSWWTPLKSDPFVVLAARNSVVPAKSLLCWDDNLLTHISYKIVNTANKLESILRKKLCPKKI